jgi:hypothetical protein
VFDSPSVSITQVGSAMSPVNKAVSQLYELLSCDRLCGGMDLCIIQNQEVRRVSKRKREIKIIYYKIIHLNADRLKKKYKDAAGQRVSNFRNQSSNV